MATISTGNGKGKARPLTRDQLDGRTKARRQFDRLAAEIQTDLEQRDQQLSAIQLALIEAFCGSAILLNALNTRILLGQEIDPAEHAAIVSSMVRVGSRLGLHRRQRDVTPSLQSYLANRSSVADDVDAEPVE